jgi:hypothetical protein
MLSCAGIHMETCQLRQMVRGDDKYPFSTIIP